MDSRSSFSTRSPDPKAATVREVFPLYQLSTDEANPDKAPLGQFISFPARFFSNAQNTPQFRQNNIKAFCFLQVYCAHVLSATVSHSA